MKKYFLILSLLSLFVSTAHAEKIAVSKQEGSATNTTTYLIDRYKVYTYGSNHKDQATCQEWKEAAPDTWTRVIAQNGVLVPSSGRCADIVLGGAKLGGVKSDELATLKKEVAELKRNQSVIFRLLNTINEMLSIILSKLK